MSLMTQINMNKQDYENGFSVLLKVYDSKTESLTKQLLKNENLATSVLERIKAILVDAKNQL
jgi:uncharacterized protein YaaR (DUF327 family)